MAEAVVSILVQSLAVELGKKFAPLQCSLACGLEEDLKTLETELLAINAIVLDAEEQQLKNEAVRLWLADLKGVAYDADDVLDLVSTEALRQKIEIHGSMLREVRNLILPLYPLAFRFKIGPKIKEIKEKLVEIAAIKSNFQFRIQSIDLRGESMRMTHPFLDESSVIGREHEKDKIVKLVLNHDVSLSVISIVGLAGLGKTTLAKFVYDDEKVIRNFDVRMWVCVAEDFYIERLVKNIIESATGVDCRDSDSSELQARLLDILNDKKFLLVLDDVWHVDAIRWQELRYLLIGGDSGSKIIVTTRSSTVAMIMGTIPPYMLKGLSDDECLYILMNRAFMNRREEGDPALIEIGKAIVAKCGGNPLSVKTLGSLLNMKTDVQEWIDIRDNDIWTMELGYGIPPALRLSYQHLPSYLKQCFAYCSIFPKDYEIGRVTLINHWMAQGFLQSRDASLKLEDIGNQYFNELVSTSFFQQVNEMFDSEIYKCKMHDLAHDLAQEVASTEWSEVNFKLKKISQGVRHVSFIGYDFAEKNFPTSLFDAKKLRSFRFSYEVGPIKKSFVKTLILRFRCLRVLDLTDSQFEELPNFVSKLKQLRFLRLSWNRSLKTLPNSICKLLNLQSLYLLDCDQLQNLPRHIGKLASLRHLYLTSKLSCMPQKGLKGLTSLQSLVLSRCENLASLSDGIKHLTSLRTLRISKCPNLAYLPSSMKYLTALEKLEIWDCRELNLESQDLQGLTKLLSLAIRELPKLVALPQGLQQSAATLQYLLIQNCSALTLLPECLKDLTLLVRLHVKGCTNLMSLPDGMRCLTALQQLSLKGCTNLMSLPDGMRCLTALQQLSIKGCTNLMSLPDGMRCLTALHQLSIKGCTSLMSLPDGMRCLTALRQLSIKDCTDLMSLPDGMRCLTALQQLTIKGCPHLSLTCKKEIGTDWPKIAHIHEIYLDSVKI